MKAAIFGVLVVVGLVKASVTPAPVECMTEADCLDTQCCFKKHEFLVVSRRQNTFEGYPVPNHQDLAHTKGVCQDYHNEGDSCSTYDKRNGYCSCNDKAGMSCNFIQDHVVTAKRAIYVPGSGSYRCTKHEELTVSRK